MSHLHQEVTNPNETLIARHETRSTTTTTATTATTTKEEKRNISKKEKKIQFNQMKEACDWLATGSFW